MRRPASRLSSSATPVGAVAFLAAALVAPSAPGAPRSPTEWERPSPPQRPSSCRQVQAGEDLAFLASTSAPGSALCLGEGRWPGPVTLGRGVTLWGGPGSVIESSGEGTTVTLSGVGSALQGLTVDGSGGRFDELDAAVHVVADDARVEGTSVVNAVFGILVEKANRVLVRGNRVEGPDEGPLGLRGDGVRLWEVRDSLIERNHVVGGRDLVVWYAPRNVIRDNLVERGRYGTHLMYSHDNDVIANTYVDNVVGIFIMYSREIGIRANLLAGGSGAAGMGLGLKESGNVEVVGNAFVDDTVGAYVDTSPLQQGDSNRFAQNLFALCETAVIFHGSEKRNTFEDNSFRGNSLQVRVEGGSDALGVTWRRNHFDDHAGYDLDRDGFSDLPHELRSLTGQLAGRRPDLAFFTGTPALALAEAAGRMLPLFRPRLLLVDEQPRMHAPAEVPRAR